MKSPADIAKAFNSLDVHDDTVEGIRVIPAFSKRSRAKVEIILNRHWKGTWRALRFTRCANIEFIVDAEVLLDNRPNNTCSLYAVADAMEIERLVRRHKEHWHVDYDGTAPESRRHVGTQQDVWAAKLRSVRDLVLFRVELFGGDLLILAPNFTMVRSRAP